MSILVVGSINADLTVQVENFPQPGETILGRDAQVYCGGKGANQAVAAAVHGVPVAMMGAVGADSYAEPSQELLFKAGVDLSNVSQVEGVSTGLAYICVDDSAENTIVVVPGANGTVDAEYVRAHEEAFAEAEVVLLQGEIPRSGIEEAIRLAEAHGARVVVNLAPVVEIDSDLLKRANPLIVNEHERQILEGRLGVDLTEAGFPSLVVTLGAEGALTFEGEETRIPAAPAAAVVDTVGAGDGFVGALTAALLKGASLVDACHAGAAFAAQVIGKQGAQQSYF